MKDRFAEFTAWAEAHWYGIVIVTGLTVILAFFFVVFSWGVGYWLNALKGMKFEINSCWSGVTALAGSLGAVVSLAAAGFAKYNTDSKFNTPAGVAPGRFSMGGQKMANETNDQTVGAAAPGNSDNGGAVSDQSKAPDTPEANPPAADNVITAAEKAAKLSDEELATQIAKMKTAAECIESGTLTVAKDAYEDLKNNIIVFEDQLSSRAKANEEKSAADLKAVEDKAQAEEAALKSKLKSIGIYGGGITGWLMLVFLSGIAVIYIVR